jgi:dethiobiotin synthetase
MNQPRGGIPAANAAQSSAKFPLVFITGTDTGVGKTLLTGLLLEWLRSIAKVDALAIKPFISGNLGDARLLARIQRDVLNLDELAPYRYELPLAPGVAAEHEGKSVPLRTAVAFIERMRRRCGCLLVEGCGGLLSPLGRSYNALDIIDRLGAHVIVVARNQLGAINQVLLTERALSTARVHSLRVVLMNRESVEEAKFLQKTLAGLLPSDTVTTLLEAAVVKAAVKIKVKSALTSDGESVNSTTQITVSEPPQFAQSALRFFVPKWGNDLWRNANCSLKTELCDK